MRDYNTLYAHRLGFSTPTGQLAKASASALAKIAHARLPLFPLNEGPSLLPGVGQAINGQDLFPIQVHVVSHTDRARAQSLRALIQVAQT